MNKTLKLLLALACIAVAAPPASHGQSTYQEIQRDREHTLQRLILDLMIKFTYPKMIEIQKKFDKMFKPIDLTLLNNYRSQTSVNMRELSNLDSMLEIIDTMDPFKDSVRNQKEYLQHRVDSVENQCKLIDFYTNLMIKSRYNNKPNVFLERQWDIYTKEFSSRFNQLIKRFFDNDEFHSIRYWGNYGMDIYTRIYSLNLRQGFILWDRSAIDTNLSHYGFDPKPMPQGFQNSDGILMEESK